MYKHTVSMKQRINRETCKYTKSMDQRLLGEGNNGHMDKQQYKQNLYVVIQVWRPHIEGGGG